jgi:hypothetical protein
VAGWNGRVDYAYDPAQNLLRRTNNAATTAFVLNPLNQITNLPAGNPAWDRRGNLTSHPGGSGAGTVTYAYDAENQLTSAQVAASWRQEYVYDARQRLRLLRVFAWKSNPGEWELNLETRHLYDGLLLVQERTGANLPTVTYTRGTDLSGTLAGAGGIGGLLLRSSGYNAGS